MRGNHHDAWVNGANDPLSGLVAELEEAKAIGELAKSGWRPKRTIQFAAWDGEEEGLHRLDGMGGDARRRVARERRRLHQLRYEFARLPRRRRLAHAGEARDAGGARR